MSFETYNGAPNHPGQSHSVLEEPGFAIPVKRAFESQLDGLAGECAMSANVWHEASQAAYKPIRDMSYAMFVQPRIEVQPTLELAHVANDLVANVQTAMEYKDLQDAMRAAGIPLSTIEPDVRVAAFARASQAAENVKDLISTRQHEEVSTALVMANHSLSKTGEHFAFNGNGSVVLLSGGKVIWTVAKPDRRE